MTRTKFMRVCVPALFLAVCAVAFAAVVAADGYAPTVTMSIQPPTGAAQTVDVPESGSATVKVGNAEYKFRPTINDAKPWTKVTVTIFKAATAQAPDSVLGTVDVVKGEAAVTSKTNPAFKVAVPKITAAPNPAEKK